MKKHIALVLTAIMLLSIAPLSAFGAEKITIEVDAQVVSFPDAQPFTDQNDRTLVPLSAVAAAMGLTSTWDDKAQIATFFKEYTNKTASIVTADSFMGTETVAFTIGKKEAIHTIYFYDLKDTEKKEPIEVQTYTKAIPMDTTAILMNERTFAPVKYLAESLGYDVAWDGASSTVSLSKRSDADYAMMIYCLANHTDYYAFVLQEGRLFEAADIAKFEITGAKVDGKDATLEPYSTEDITILKEGGLADYLSGGRIRSTFTINTSHKISLNYTQTSKDGTSSSSTYVFDFLFDDIGGFM